MSADQMGIERAYSSKEKKKNRPVRRRSAKIIAGDTIREAKFAAAYIEDNGDASAAARAISPHGLTDGAAEVIGHRLLTRVNVQPRLRKWIDDGAGIKPLEIIGRLADQARADITDLLTEEGKFDLVAIHNAGLGHLIKSIVVRQTKYGEEVRIEVHNPQVADALLGRYLRLEQAPVTINLNGECDRKVLFLAHHVRQALRDGAPSAERAWEVIEQAEREIFQQDVSDLKAQVLAAVGPERLALWPPSEPEVPPGKSGPGSGMVS